MIVEIHVTLRDDNSRDGLGEWIGSIAILNTDSTDRAIATYMDSNPVVAKAIEDGSAYVETTEIYGSWTPKQFTLSERVNLIKAGDFERAKRPNKALDPSWFGDIANDPTIEDLRKVVDKYDPNKKR